MEIYTKCIDNYKKYIDSGDQKTLESCVDNLKLLRDIDKYKQTQLYDEIYGKCIVLNNKKKDLYVYKYDISPIIKKINELNKNIVPNNIKCALTDPDIVIDKNDVDCCNCINIVLYYNKYHDVNGLSTYMSNLKTSLSYIEKYLPTWIMRLYLDITLFETIYNFMNSSEEITRKKGEYYNNILQFLSVHSQCEIHIELSEKTLDLGYKALARNLRLNGLYDDDVNICVSRDADGIITPIDCHNIKIFEKKEELFFSYSFLNMIVLKENPENYEVKNIVKISKKFDGFENAEVINDKIDIITGNYSSWLNTYKIIRQILYNDERFKTNISFITILAGIFACKIKFNKKYVADIKKKINDVMNKLYDPDIMNKLYDPDLTNIYDTDNEFVLNSLYILTIGYDEIQLMEMFMPFLLCHIEAVQTFSYENCLHTAQQKKESTFTIDKKIKYLYEKIFPVVSHKPNHAVEHKYSQIIPSTTHLSDLIKNKTKIKKMLDIQEEEYINFNPDDYVIDRISDIFLNLNEPLFSNDTEFNDIIKHSDLYYQKYLKYKNKYLKLKNN